MTTFVWPPLASGSAQEATQLLVLAAVDGLETLATSTNTKLDTLDGSVDAVKTAVDLTTTAVNTVKTAVDSTNTKLDTALTRLAGNFVNVAYDYMTYTSGATNDVYVFKTGGAGGTTVKTLTINYVDSTKQVITTVAAT